MEQHEQKQEVTATQKLNSDSETEIDLMELFHVFTSNLHQIVFFLLLGAVIMNAYSYFFIHPTYESTAKLYVVSASGGSVLDLTDLNLGSSLAYDYEELILSYPVLEQVIDELNLDMDYMELQKLITITNPTDTRVLRIVVTTTEAELSAEIANSIMYTAQEYLPETMSITEPNVAQVARASEEKVAPSYARFTVIGALIGALIAMGLLTMRYILDDTIRTAEDMEKEFGMVPLTSIPESEMFAAVDENDSAVVEKMEKSRWIRIKRAIFGGRGKRR